VFFDASLSFSEKIFRWPDPADDLAATGDDRDDVVAAGSEIGERGVREKLWPF
jgi:hypothetical protein